MERQLDDVFQQDEELQGHGSSSKFTEEDHPEQLKVAYDLETQIGWDQMRRDWSKSRPSYKIGYGRLCSFQLKEILSNELLTSKQEIIQALESECKSWLGARMWFKDVSSNKLELLFQNQFSAAVGIALKQKLQKLNPENEQEEILLSVLMVKELLKEMPLRFKQIIANRELE
jgi:hypothetical protein